MYIFHENRIRNRFMYFFHKYKNTKSFDVHFHENSRNTNAQGERQSAELPMPNQIRLILLVARPSIALPLPRWSTEMKNCHSNHNEFVAAASYLCHLPQVDRSQFYSDASIYTILNKPMSFDDSSKHLC